MKRFFPLLLILLLFFSCVRRDIRFVPGPGQSVEVLNLKFLLSQENGRQTGKIRWKFAEGTSTALFLSPINQVLFEMYAQGENVLLINRRERVYWEGDFQSLIRRYWNMELKLAEIRKIVSEGIVPAPLNTDPAIRIELFRNRDQTVERVEISNEKSNLSLRVLKRESVPGKIVPPSDLEKFGHRDFVEDVIGRV
jgi:hypothetical protein